MERAALYWALLESLSWLQQQLYCFQPLSLQVRWSEVGTHAYVPWVGLCSMWPLHGSTACLALADLMSVKRMMEKMGAPKTHLELKKMISEVTGGVSETISYQDFVNVMLGKRSAVLKL